MGNSRSYHRELMIREMPQSVRQLHLAVKSNDRETVNDLLSRGVNINFPFLCGSNRCIKDGNTPLIIAVSLNHIEMVETLLRAGAYINKCDKEGCTPVYKAAFHGRPSLIEILTKAGADVNLADFQGKTPLYICVNNAVVHTCRSAILKLLSAGAIVDKCDKLGQAPIHMAAHWKLVDVLVMLLAARSNVDLCDSRGRTPVYMLVRSLTTKLYLEDLRLRMPCIVALFRAKADMLNLVEWLLHKGPGIPTEMIEHWSDFHDWYRLQLSQPMTLANMCRKVVQMRLTACLKTRQRSLKRPKGYYGSYHAHGGYYVRYHHEAQPDMYGGGGGGFIPPSFFHSKAAQSLSRCFPLNSDSTPQPIIATTFQDRQFNEGLVAAVRKLPVPQKIQIYLSRKMFFKESPDVTTPLNDVTNGVEVHVTDNSNHVVSNNQSASFPSDSVVNNINNNEMNCENNNISSSNSTSDNNNINNSNNNNNNQNNNNNNNNNQNNNNNNNNNQNNNNNNNIIPISNNHDNTININHSHHTNSDNNATSMTSQNAYHKLTSTHRSHQHI